MAALEKLMAAHPRVRVLREGEPDGKGDCVLYWMQRSQRALDNPALNLAIALGNTLGLPVLAVFGLTASYPGAQRRHYQFLLEGLRETVATLEEKRGVAAVVRLGSPEEVVLKVASECQPAIVVGDENPVRVGQQWRDRVADGLGVPFRVVDGDVVVPTSLFPKEEYAARTIRPKIHRVLAEYLKPMPELRAKVAWPAGRVPGGEKVEVEPLLRALGVGGAAGVAGYRGGTEEALRRLDVFVTERLPRYNELRNKPTPYMTSELSAHLHFGHISPLTIALRVRDAEAPQADIDSYLEELIVRREVAINFVARNPYYDQLRGCPDWGLKTLAKHAGDPRPYLYEADELEAGRTHDPVWNAAQREMVLTGRMHNYLRMYWAKKILEWTADPETAFDVALDLNDRYEMDGRDPNGYTGVAWAIGGKHDRPWGERPIFGMIRYMSYDGIRKKLDTEAYIRWVNKIEGGKRQDRSLVSGQGRVDHDVRGDSKRAFVDVALAVEALLAFERAADVVLRVDDGPAVVDLDAFELRLADSASGRAGEADVGEVEAGLVGVELVVGRNGFERAGRDRVPRRTCGRRCRRPRCRRRRRRRGGLRRGRGACGWLPCRRPGS